MTPSGPERRSRLAAAPNPGRGDYVVSLDGALSGGWSVQLHYVPDRAIVGADDFRAYLNMLGGIAWESPEQMGAAMLEDVSNALVPRWLRVELCAQLPGPLTHRVRLEDRQPGWKNEVLTGR